MPIYEIEHPANGKIIEIESDTEPTRKTIDMAFKALNLPLSSTQTKNPSKFEGSISDAGKTYSTLGISATNPKTGKVKPLLDITPKEGSVKIPKKNTAVALQRMLSGVVKGGTGGVVDIAKGEIGIPFTDNKISMPYSMNAALADSPEGYDPSLYKGEELLGEIGGGIAPFAAASKAARLLPYVGRSAAAAETIAGAGAGAAMPREEGQDMLQQALWGGSAGAVGGALEDILKIGKGVASADILPRFSEQGRRAKAGEILAAAGADSPLNKDIASLSGGGEGLDAAVRLALTPEKRSVMNQLTDFIANKSGSGLRDRRLQAIYEEMGMGEKALPARGGLEDVQSLARQKETALNITRQAEIDNGVSTVSNLSPLEPEIAGARTVESLTGAADEAYAPVQKAYQQIADIQLPTDTLSTRLAGIVEKAGRIGDRDFPPLIADLYRKTRGNIEEVADLSGYGMSTQSREIPGELNIGALNEYRSDLTALAKNGNPTERMYAQKAVSAIDDFEKKIINDNMIGADEIEKLRSARGMYSDYASKYLESTAGKVKNTGRGLHVENRDYAKAIPQILSSPASVRQFRRAVNDSPDAINDIVSFLDYELAGNPNIYRTDGSLNKAIVDTFITKRRAALKELGVADRYSNISSLAARINQTKKASDAYTKSMLYRTLGVDGDTAISSILGSTNPQMRMKELVSDIGINKAALDGLKKAMWTDFKAKITSMGSETATGLSDIKLAEIQKYYAKNRNAMKELHTADELKAYENMWRLGRKVGTANKMPPGSSTQIREQFATSMDRGTLPGMARAAIIKGGSSYSVGIMAEKVIGHVLRNIKDVSDKEIFGLVEEALFDPKLAKELMDISKLPAKTAKSRIDKMISTTRIAPKAAQSYSGIMTRQEDSPYASGPDTEY